MMKKKYFYAVILVTLFLFAGLLPAFGQDEPVVDDPCVPEEPYIPGTVEGTGTYFEVSDSNYLNITFESSVPVYLILESVPKMILMDIEAADTATLTWVILTGFEPSTTYYKYEDDYHNEVVFTTDASGSYTYTQDLSVPHLVFIQPQSGTIFIPDNNSVGIWDDVNRVYTLTTDVYETIQIDQNNLTLDGDGYTVTGTGSGYGVYLPTRTGVTIKNVNIQGFPYGIYLQTSSDCNLTDNTISNNPYGIRLEYSTGNTLTGNTASNNSYGIYLSHSSGNTLTDNTANSNNYSGIYLLHSSGNTLTDNTANSNSQYGIYLSYSSYNLIYNNNFIDNAVQACIHHGSGNLFNLPAPTGGNYWSDWTSPDNDGDGFVDNAYPIYDRYGNFMAQDDLPWTRQDGWLVIEVDIDIKPGNYPNAVKLGSYGLIPVAILSSEYFDATTVDPDTVALAGASVAVRGKSNKFMSHQEDVSGDGLVDLILQVATQNLDPDTFQDGYAILTGETYDGWSIVGKDEIAIVPPEK